MDEAGLKSLAFDDPAELAKILDRADPVEEAGEQALLDQFEVVVECRDERHQKDVFDRLRFCW